VIQRTTCKGVGHVFWCTILKQRIRCFGPNDQPNFQPVTLKILPALPMVTVLSHIPGSVAATHQITSEMLLLLLLLLLLSVCACFG